MSGKLAACRCIVSGRVQGVFFRDSTARRAAALGVAGHARNLPDGTVEVFAVGAPDALAGLRAWLEVGPPAARVARVDSVEEAVPADPPTRFSTG